MRRAAAYALGVFMYVAVTVLVVSLDPDAHCYQGPFRPRLLTYVVLFPLPLITWITRRLAGAASSRWRGWANP